MSDRPPLAFRASASLAAACLTGHRRGVLTGFMVVGLLLASGVVARVSEGSIDYGEGEEDDASAALPPEERAARRACVMCHLFVEPEMLTRKNWTEQILPRMKARLGVAKPDYASSPEGELIRARKVYREEPMVPVEDWPLIEKYYLSNAPDKPLPQDPKPPINVGLKHFEPELPRVRFEPPSTTMIRISPSSRRIYLGDDRSQRLVALDGLSGAPVATTSVGNVPVDITERETGFFITGLGSFIPTEYWLAELLFVEKSGDGFGTTKRVLKNLPRTTQALFADFNGDGLEDFMLCMFGNLTGRFSWFEQLVDGGYEEHLLTEHTGATRVLAHDFNKDGHPDVAVLFSQDMEMLIILMNDGKGSFTGQTIIQEPPVFGHTYFELVDFNRDGKMDVLVCNGDNGEYQSPTKRYHGIRLLINEGELRGELQFKQAWFYPLNGCYAAVARDFDEDGDLDIAAISYFPDYETMPRESFVYLENDGAMHFTASTFRECISGRWVVMDAGDVDGDGDVDIVLGSYIRGPTSAPAFLVETWEKQGASLQILRNTLR